MQHMNTFSKQTVKRHLFFENQGNLNMDWILDVNILETKYIVVMYILWNGNLFLKIFQERLINSKKKRNKRGCLNLKTGLHGRYGLNCVHPPI